MKLKNVVIVIIILIVACNAAEQLKSFGENGQIKMLYDARQRPQSVYYNGKLFIGFNAGADDDATGESDSSPMIIEYDLETREFSPYVDFGNYDNDHHNCPVVFPDMGGYLHVLYGWHNEIGTHLISKDPEYIGKSLNNWNKMPTIDHEMSYPWTRRIYDNKQIIYYRTHGHPSSWTYRITDDRGQTWTGPENDVTDLNMDNELYGALDWSSYQAKAVSKDGKFLHVGFIAYDDVKTDPDPERFYNPRYDQNVSYNYNLYYVKIDLQTFEVRNYEGKILDTPIDRYEADSSCMIWDTNWRGGSIVPTIFVDENDEPTFLYNISDETPEDLDYHYVRRENGNWKHTRITHSNHEWNSGHLERSTDGTLHAYIITGEGYFEKEGYMDKHGGGRIEEWISKDDGNTWEKERDISPGPKTYPGWKFNNIRPVTKADGTIVEDMFLFYGWKDESDPRAKAFLLDERPLDPTDAKPPSQPNHLCGSSSTGEIVLNWEASDDEDLYYYKIYRNNSNDSTNADVIGSVYAPVLSYTDNKPSIESDNYYWCSAVDANGNESPLSVGTGNINVNIPPVISSATAVSPAESIKLAETDAEVVVEVSHPGSELTSVMLHYNYNTETDWQAIDMSAMGDNQYVTNIEGQPAGTVVNYYITATVDNGLSATYPANAIEEENYFMLGWWEDETMTLGLDFETNAPNGPPFDGSNYEHDFRVFGDEPLYSDEAIAGNYSLNFQGKSCLIIDSAPFITGAAFTVDTWIKPIATYSNGSHDRICSKHNVNGEHKEGTFYLRFIDGEKPMGVVNYFEENGSIKDVKLTMDSKVEMEQWYHVILAAKSDTCVMQLRDMDDELIEKIGKSIKGPIVTDAGRFVLGAAEIKDNEIHHEFYGAIDKFRFYNYYRLGQNNENMVEDVINLPTRIKLAQNYPNPFNPKTTISFSIQKKGNVNVTIVDLMGRKIRSLLNEVRPAGMYKVNWNGLDDAGNRVSSGIYFTRLSTQGHTKMIKMMLLR